MLKIINLITKYKITIITTIISTIIVLSVMFILADIKQNKIYKNAESQIIELSQNIIKSYRLRPDYWGLSTDEVINKKLYSSGMKINNNKLIGIFDKLVEVGSDETGNVVMPTQKHFVIAYKNFNKIQCVKVLSQKFNKNFWLSVNKITIKNNEISQDFVWGSNDFALPISPKNLRNLCVSEKNTIIMQF